MRKIRYTYIYIISALLLAACSKDEEAGMAADSQTGKDGSGMTVFELRSCMPSFEGEYPTSRTTRAWTPPTGYSTYDAINGVFEGRQSLLNTSIETFFTKDGSDPEQGTFYYDEYNSCWRLNMDLKEVGDYFLYGFLPKTEASSSSVAPNGTYSAGSVLTINGLGTVTPADVCVIVGAKDGISADNDNGLATGKFTVRAKPGVGDNHNYIFLLFDHIYSAVGLRFTVDATYNALRTIKLRKLEMKAVPDDGGAAVKARQNAQVTLLANNTGTSPIVGSVVFTPDNSSSDAEMQPLYNGADVTLSNSVPVSFMGCFIPGSTNTFKVRTTYDVYDKAGNKIREGCTAENTISLRDIYGMSLVERGHMYYITFKVQPTYLYVLSDPDLDNPTMVVDD